MVEIKTQFDLKLRKLIKNKKQIAIIPIGSIEQHGPHLPLSTDSDIVSEVAKKISEKNGYLLLPTITFGVSFEHKPFFNLSIRKSTLQIVLMDLCVSLLDIFLLPMLISIFLFVTNFLLVAIFIGLLIS